MLSKSFIVWVLFVTQGATAAPSYLSLTTDFPAQYDMAGFVWLSRVEYFRVFDGDAKSHAVLHGGQSYHVHWQASSRLLSVTVQGVATTVDLRKVLEAGRAYQTAHPGARAVPQNLLQVEGHSKAGRLRFYIEDLSVEAGDVLHLKGDLLFGPPSQKVH